MEEIWTVGSLRLVLEDANVRMAFELLQFAQDTFNKYLFGTSLTYGLMVADLMSQFSDLQCTWESLKSGALCVFHTCSNDPSLI